jgi:hypothetical protein
MLQDATEGPVHHRCSDAGDDGVHMMLCTSWKALRLQDSENDDDCSFSDEESSSSSSASSLADTIAHVQCLRIQAEPGGVFCGASPGDDSVYHLHITLDDIDTHMAHDMHTAHDYEKTHNGGIYSNAHRSADVCLLAQTSDCYDYQRFESVDLALPTPLITSTHLASHGAFWAQTASNLETLVSLGLIGHCSLVARGVHGEEVEMEVDAASLRLWGKVLHESDVRLLRVSADIETMRAHALDCAHCAEHARARYAEPKTFGCTPIGPVRGWEAWWGTAMCLADYLSFHSRHSQHVSLVGGHVHGGCDLAFLGASTCS